MYQPDILCRTIYSLCLQKQYNISNSNFYPVHVTQLSLRAMYGQHILTETENDTALYIPLRSVTPHFIQVNVTFEDDEGYLRYVEKKISVKLVK